MAHGLLQGSGEGEEQAPEESTDAQLGWVGTFISALSPTYSKCCVWKKSVPEAKAILDI